MIDETQTAADNDAGTEEQRIANIDEQASYEDAAAWYLENDEDVNLSWEEERDLFRDEDGDLNLAREDLPSYLLVLEDFHAEFVYEVKAYFHLHGIGEREKAIRCLSDIVKDHLADGNNKITETTAILNLNSAADCPNRKSERCQVAFSMCYAHVSEDQYTRKRQSDGRYVGPLVARRREEYLRDVIRAEDYARAFLSMNQRKAEHWAAKPFDTLRVSESGDFRGEADIHWVNEVARILGEEQGVDVYTYSASKDLDWSLATHFTVNASAGPGYGDAQFKAEDPAEFELGENEAWCPNDLQKVIRRLLGESFDDVVKCGECRLCVDQNNIDVVIPIHAAGIEKLGLDDIRDHISDEMVAKIEAHQNGADQAAA